MYIKFIHLQEKCIHNYINYTYFQKLFLMDYKKKLMFRIATI